MVLLVTALVSDTLTPFVSRLLRDTGQAFKNMLLMHSLPTISTVKQMPDEPHSSTSPGSFSDGLCARQLWCGVMSPIWKLMVA